MLRFDAAFFLLSLAAFNSLIHAWMGKSALLKLDQATFVEMDFWASKVLCHAWKLNKNNCHGQMTTFGGIKMTQRVGSNSWPLFVYNEVVCDVDWQQMRLSSNRLGSEKSDMISHYTQYCTQDIAEQLVLLLTRAPKVGRIVWVCVCADEIAALRASR